MKVEDFLENKNIWTGTLVADMHSPENYFKLVELLKDYSVHSEKRIKLLEFMVENGLGEQDMQNDIIYPHEL